MSHDRFWSLTEGEFARFSPRYRHKKAAEVLRIYHEVSDSHALLLYRRLEQWLQLPTIAETDFKALSDRYHLHLSLGRTSWKEHNLLQDIRQNDRPSEIAFLPLSIYLDNLRSAYNVGSIIRTAEAFRLGSLYFAKDTPFIDNSKVQKTSMSCFDKVPCFRNIPLTSLPRPLIALETAPNAPTIFEVEFPSTFTLMLGNEEYGLSEESLAEADELVQIPLCGYKRSLNVASAFAIAAACIRRAAKRC